MRLLDLILIFCYSLCFHFLSVVCSEGDGLPCAPSICANLDNVSFPFGAAPHCGASPSFLLSNCNTEQAYWYGFNASVPDGIHSIRPPAVVGIGQAGRSNYVNLTWDITSSESAQEFTVCRPVPYRNISDYLPNSIDLTAFANSIFEISPNNVYLLFNCTNTTSLSSSNNSPAEADTSVCTSYLSQCNLDNTTVCFQSNPHKEVMLQQVMDSLVCTHFQFFVTSDNSLAVKEWRAGMVQLYWTESQIPSESACTSCAKTNGTCGYDDQNHFACFCPGNQNFSTACGPVNHVCNGRLCSTGSRIAIGMAVAAIAILVVLALCCLRRRRKSTRQIFEAGSRFRKAAFRSQKSCGANSFNQLDFNGLCECPIEFSYNSLASATASFSTILGEGGFGVVYKGTVEANSNIQVAVKVLEASSRHSSKQFLNEVATIGNIHHVNVVRLLGFCVEKSQKILVYELVVNGSLDRWLFKGKDELNMGGNSKAQAQLDWKQRYAVAVGIARGLCYLHEECRHRIVHCDIKPENILLDEQMRPKIADFGLAKLMSRGESQVVTLAKGTPGYVAPEFWTGGESRLSTKFDVYSYGMVLLELLSGRRNFVDLCFPAMAFEATMHGDFKSILDVESVTTEMAGELTGTDWHQVRIAMSVAMWCIQDHPARRPCMSEVVQYLEGVAAVPEQPPRPAIASTGTTPCLPLRSQNHTPIALSEGR